jgi:hypothetical protein
MISHGRKDKNKQKHLPRINTEFHGKDRSRDTETKKHHSEPDALATVVNMQRR